MNMTFVGFLKEEDKNIREGHYFTSMFRETPNEEEVRVKILAYLKSGIILIGALSTISDDDNKLIVQLNYYTDGKFIWPIYYTHYIEKYDRFLISQPLFEHAIQYGFTIPVLSKEVLLGIEKIFTEEWSGKWQH